MTEILNIDYHTRRLLLRALNEKPSKVKAAVALGVSEKSLYRMIKRFDVKKGREGYYIQNHATTKNTIQ